jgi:outer membrane biosynthesis protein TonB
VRASQRSDAALLARVRRGDRQALRLLYGRYAAEVFDFAVRFTGAADGAAAIVEATFATAHDRLGVGIRPQRVEPWLLGIARGLALDGDAPSVSLPLGGGRRDDRLGLTRRWAETLTPRDYALVDLYVRRGLSVRELATVIGSGEQALRGRLERLAIDLEAFVSSGLVLGRVGRCLELPTLLAIVRGAEAADMRRAVRLHARQCDVCRASLGEPSSSLGALAELPAAPLPGDLSASIWTHLAAHVADGVRREPRRAAAAASTRPAPGRSRRPWIAAAAGASACAAGVLAFVLTDRFGDPETRETRASTEAVTPKLGSPTSVFTPPEAAKTKKNETVTGAPATPPPASPPPSSPPAAATPPAALPPASQPPAPPPPSQPQSTKPKPKTTPKPSAPAREEPPAAQAQKPAAKPKPRPAPDPAAAPASPSRAKSVGLAWAEVPNAIGYEVVLKRGGRRVYKERTSKARTTIPTSWKVDGRTVELKPGYYQWLVWPIFDEGKAATAVVVAAVHLD